MRWLLLACLLSSSPAFAAEPRPSWRAQLPVGAVPAATPVVAAAPGAPADLAARFDYYVLSLEWHPAFCASMAEKGHSPSECQPPASEAFDGALVLHGMWPSRRGDAGNSYGFCGVSPDIRRLDTAATRCQMPPVPMSAATRDTLVAHMPGTDDCLERHEWFRHGTCSGLSSDEYFAAADALMLQALGSRLGRFVAARAGSRVSGADLAAAAAADWGGAARASLRLACITVGGAPVLSEVRLALASSVGAGSSLGASLVAAEGSGSCPASFEILGGPTR